jgi:hypothetical protein
MNDRLRQFVLNYCVDDATFTVSERQIRNSGFPGGRFFRATTAINPDTKKPYRPDEVVIGRDVVINCWRFHLYEASAGSLTSMEENSAVFPESDLGKIVKKIQTRFKGKVAEVRGKLEAFDPHRHGKIETCHVIDVLNEYAVTLTEQELLRVFREYAFGDEGLFCYQDFLGRFA